MYFFDATHNSVNADPAAAPDGGAQTSGRQTKKVKTEPRAQAVPPATDTQVIPAASYIYTPL